MIAPAQILAGYGFSPWVGDGEWRHTSLMIGPDSCIDGTDRPRTAVLFGHVDVVSGSPPSGPMHPTVDLELRLFEPPRSGLTHFAGRTLRLGGSLYVGEVELRHDRDKAPFGIAVATFVNGLRLPVATSADPPEVTPAPCLTGADRVAPGVVELAEHLDTPQGSVTGAVLALLAEEAAIDVLAGTDGVGDTGVALDELQLRFLDKVRVGPVRARATVVADGEARTVRVSITDAGNADRWVAYALAVCRPLAPT